MDLEPHLLIVDDDERIRGLLQKFLMRNGFLVSAARDAAHARRILAGLEFDMIILDVMMPLDPVFGFPFGGQQHDRRFGGLPNGRRQAYPILTRHHHVKDDHVKLKPRQDPPL